MAFCPNCGNSVANGSRFCDNCGNPLSPQARPSARPSGRSSSKMPLEAILSLSALGCAGTALFCSLLSLVEFFSDRSHDEFPIVMIIFSFVFAIGAVPVAILGLKNSICRIITMACAGTALTCILIACICEDCGILVWFALFFHVHAVACDVVSLIFQKR